MIKTRVKPQARLDNLSELLYSNLSVNEKGHLAIAGYDAVELGKGVWHAAVCAGPKTGCAKTAAFIPRA
jgi:hypothetical protein